MARPRQPDGSVPPLRQLNSLLLAHGAGSGPWVFDGWAAAFPELEVEAVDLHAGLNVAEAAMSNYAAVIARAAEWLPRPLALCGWSSGGLAAMMAARPAEADLLVLLETSPPGEVQGFDDSVVPEAGTFDPEATYGAFPAGMRARPESLLARGERKRGVSVPSLPCPALVVYGDEFAEERGRRLAAFYGAEELPFRDVDHWGLVRDARVRDEIAGYLSRSTG
ncbi:MAG TPA: alpha/beta fold hydrolase [Gaiellaceae bacterium]|jgi:pimeloyl-ACP methyl ester carboxylesterase|nr:alpha/beta fold hydrolase [Gaiellaceae bacterium]